MYAKIIINIAMSRKVKSVADNIYLCTSAEEGRGRIAPPQLESENDDIIMLFSCSVHCSNFSIIRFFRWFVKYTPYIHVVHVRVCACDCGTLMLAAVYKGTYNNQDVAVKALKDDSKAAQGFLAEASVMT